MGFSLCPKMAEGEDGAVSSSRLWQRGSAEPSPASCLRADLCPLPAGSLRLHPLSPWTALPPRKTSPPQVLPPVCAGLDMEPVALCWLEHALPLSHTQLPPCLYSNLGEADTWSSSFCRHRNRVKGLEDFQGVTQPRRPKWELDIWIPFSLPKPLPLKKSLPPNLRGVPKLTPPPILSSGLQLYTPCFRQGNSVSLRPAADCTLPTAVRPDHLSDLG